MNAAPDNESAVAIRPPQLIQSLVGGFNTVASNIPLIVMPVLLDLLLWFGPHLRMKTLMDPQVTELMALMRQTSSLDMRPGLENLEKLWRLFLDQYNIFSSVSTFPIGVPSLMAGQSPMRTPLGLPQVYEVSSAGQLFFGWLGLTLLGFALGTIYFAWIATTCGKTMPQIECTGSLPARLMGNRTGNRIPPLTPGTLLWETVQVVALAILLAGIVLVLMIPTLILATFLALVSPILAQMALLLVSFSVVWFLVPLIFSPHGIFLCGQSVINAMLNSTRIVRYILPGTGLFLLASLVLNQGLGLLWRTPPGQSWMALIGILGHAFVITGLLAASFIYYRGGLSYVQSQRKYRL